MKFRVGRAIASTVAVAAATLMATVGNASADIPPGINWDHTYTSNGVRVYVEEHGDIISVCDAKANGKRAWVTVLDTQVPVYDSVVTGGFGSCETHRASQGGRYNLREGRYFTLAFDGNGTGTTRKTYLNDH